MWGADLCQGFDSRALHLGLIKRWEMSHPSDSEVKLNLWLDLSAFMFCIYTAQLWLFFADLRFWIEFQFISSLVFQKIRYVCQIYQIYMIYSHAWMWPESDLRRSNLMCFWCESGTHWRGGDLIWATLGLQCKQGLPSTCIFNVCARCTTVSGACWVRLH